MGDISVEKEVVYKTGKRMRACAICGLYKPFTGCAERSVDEIC